MAKMTTHSYSQSSPSLRLEHHLHTRIFWLWCLLVISWSILGIRLWQLQIIKGQHYRQISERNYTRIMPISAPRGRIYDRHGQLILGNRLFYDLVIIPQFVQDPHQLTSHLSTLLGLKTQQLHALISAIYAKPHPKFLPITIKTNLTHHQVALIESAQAVLPGVHITKNIRRDYTTSPPPHLIGYVAKPSAGRLKELQTTSPHQLYKPSDYVGQYGLEKIWDNELRGKDGKQFLQVDALGRRVGDLGDLGDVSNLGDGGEPNIQLNMPQIPAISGHHLILTLDRELQQIATTAFKGKTGAVVVIDAKDGGILAMVSAPAYPSDLYQSRISTHQWQRLMTNPNQPLFDKTTGAEYAPGSTFKVILALAALQEAIIHPTTTINCPGRWQLGRRTFHCHKRGGHGNVNLTQALSQSCNIYFYELAMQLGVDKIATYAQLFELGQQLGLPLNKEAAGLIPTRLWRSESKGGTWYRGETALLGVGQGHLLITPLQLARLYATIGSGGWLTTPYLVRKVVSRLGETIHQRSSLAPRRIKLIERRHFKLIQTALLETVNSDDGSGVRARVGDVAVAAKTGTVQVVTMKRNQDRLNLFQPQDRPLRTKEHALIAAFAPAHDAEIAVAVVSQHDAVGGGGRAAAPVAQKIIAGYYQLKHQRRLAQNYPTPVSN